jgi:hypothetical protein
MRIGLVYEPLEWVRQLNAKGPDQLWSIADDVSSSFGLREPLLVRSDNWESLARNDLGGLAALVFSSNALRHRDSRLFNQIYESRSLVRRKIEEGLPTIAMHQFKPDLLNEILPGGVRVAGSRTSLVSEIEYAASDRVFNLPTKADPKWRLHRNDGEQAAWTAIDQWEPSTHEQIVSNTESGQALIVRSRVSASARLVVSTLPLDWMDEQQLIRNCFVFALSDPSSPLFFQDTRLGATRAVVPDGVLTVSAGAKELKDWLHTASPDDLPRSVISLVRDPSSVVELNKVCLGVGVRSVSIDAASPQRSVVENPSPAVVLASEQLADLLETRVFVTDFFEQSRSQVFPVKQILLATLLSIRSWPRLLFYLKPDAILDGISTMISNIQFDGMTASTKLAIRQICFISRGILGEIEAAGALGSDRESTARSLLTELSRVVSQLDVAEPVWPASGKSAHEEASAEGLRALEYFSVKLIVQGIKGDPSVAPRMRGSTSLDVAGWFGNPDVSAAVGLAVGAGLVNVGDGELAKLLNRLNETAQGDTPMVAEAGVAARSAARSALISLCTDEQAMTWNIIENEVRQQSLNGRFRALEALRVISELADERKRTIDRRNRSFWAGRIVAILLGVAASVAISYFGYFAVTGFEGSWEISGVSAVLVVAVTLALAAYAFLAVTNWFHALGGWSSRTMSRLGAISRELKERSPF